MGEILNARRASSDERLQKLEAALTNAAELAAGKACVYVTGSFGRGEASEHSDLDLFIVASGGADGASRGSLSRLDEICIKADLIRAARDQHFQEFSRDGEYLVHYTVGQLIKNLGAAVDDALNTFTARLLLLLESRSLVGKGVHENALKEVVQSYWRDFRGHEGNFQPAFLANDIMRLWRTFCVNYEARTQSEPAEKKAKRKLKNYKLKHSRLLTCYSALLYLSAILAEAGTVTEEAALQMTRLTPTQRVEALVDLTTEVEPSGVVRIIDCYEKFLRETNASEGELLERFKDPQQSRAYAADAQALGDAVHAVLRQVGEKSGFYRMLVV